MLQAATLEEIEARMLAAAQPRPSRSPVPIPGAVTPRGGSFDLQRNSVDLMRGSYDPHRSSVELQRHSFSGVPTPPQMGGSPGGGFGVPARPGFGSGQGAYHLTQGGSHPQLAEHVTGSTIQKWEVKCRLSFSSSVCLSVLVLPSCC